MERVESGESGEGGEGGGGGESGGGLGMHALDCLKHFTSWQMRGALLEE